jgi:hypothetical protein
LDLICRYDEYFRNSGNTVGSLVYGTAELILAAGITTTLKITTDSNSKIDEAIEASEKNRILALLQGGELGWVNQGHKGRFKQEPDYHPDGGRKGPGLLHWTQGLQRL